MKKSILAVAGLAAVAGIAGPAGVFAANENFFTETVKFTVENSCSIYDGASDTDRVAATDKTYSNILANGALWNVENDGGEDISGSYHVTCNDTNGWYITAVGAQSNDNSRAVNTMHSSNEAGDDIATGTQTEGIAGKWAFKINSADSGLTITDTYGAYHTVPDTAQTVLTSSKAGTDENNGKFTTGYQVYVGTQTPAGTYEGKVKYQFVHPIENPGA